MAGTEARPPDLLWMILCEGPHGNRLTSLWTTNCSMRECQKMAPKQKLLVFIVAYQAEKTISWVLNRIPKEIFESFETQVLIVDDASSDKTFDVALEYKTAHVTIPIVAIRNEHNQGYGGNQKVGYYYAIKNGFDFVALLHGDGQYAPEELPNLLKPLQSGEADAVLGSRMMTRWLALRGGMPLYKYIGNRILTTFQNWMLKSHLSEFHSGYRIYSVRSLINIPFLLNTNDFHFDTEILIQLMNAKARIQESPIPTYYGDEICYVNGIQYAFHVAVATIKNVLHRSGLLYQRRYDTLPSDASYYDLKLTYPSSHTAALDQIPTGSIVLDMGGGPGDFARYLSDKKHCEVTVVDQFAPREKTSPVRYIVQDLNQDMDFSIRDYQYILLLDVLEHLKDPEHFLEELRRQFTFETKKFIITTPNIAFFVQRLMLMIGQFNYGKVGILDRTHSRLFTFRSLKYLLRDAGFKFDRMRGIPAPFPKAIGENWISKLLLRLNELLIHISPELFSYQIFVLAESTPHVNYIVEHGVKSSERRLQIRVKDASISEDEQEIILGAHPESSSETIQNRLNFIPVPKK
jgi:glycosyltransferase involved in cell wall biosynthesis/2-polyprenyl-3-methyl-5-hydroxy-6-metoxy-1,4-benzoquinol methylase